MIYIARLFLLIFVLPDKLIAGSISIITSVIPPQEGGGITDLPIFSISYSGSEVNVEPMVGLYQGVNSHLSIPASNNGRIILTEGDFSVFIQSDLTFSPDATLGVHSASTMFVFEYL